MISHLLLIILITPLICLAVSAGSNTVEQMPWDGPLDRLRQSLTGKAAFYVSIIGVFAAGLGLLFGGEINEFARKGVLIGFVISIVVFASQILEKIFLFSGAMI